MKTKRKLSDGEKVRVLAGMLLFVIRGLRNKSISSKPIMLTSAAAKEYPMTSLEAEAWKALNKCGITEKKK